MSSESFSGCATIAYSFVAFALAGAVLSGISDTLGTIATVVFVAITVWFGYYRAELRRQRRRRRTP